MGNEHYLLSGVPTTIRYAPFRATVLGGGSIIPRYGYKQYFADYGNGGEPGIGDGTLESPWKTVSGAYGQMTAETDEALNLLGGGSAGTYAFRESATLTWSKNLTHLLAPNVISPIAHRASLRVLSGATVFSPFMLVSADGCRFENLHIYYGFDDASAQVALQVTGSRNVFVNCHIAAGGEAVSGGGGQDHTGNRSLSVGSGGAGENMFIGCTFGLDTVVYGGANSVIDLVGGSPRNTFYGCTFLSFCDAGGAGREFVTIGSGGIDRWVKFIDCDFINCDKSTGTTMTQAFSVHASAGGYVLLRRCNFVGVTDVETSASGLVYIDNPVVDTIDGALMIVNSPS